MASGLIKQEQTSRWASIFARNIGGMESYLDTMGEEWEAFKQQINTDSQDVDDMQGTLLDFEAIIESMGVSRLSRINRPNLLKQNYWTEREMPTSPVITETFTVPAEDATAAAANLTFTVTNEAITADYKLHGWKISDYTIVSWTSLSGTFAAGSATITIGPRTAEHAGAVTVTVYLCTNAMTKVLYGNASRISGSSYPYMKSINSGNYPGDDSADGIVCSVVDLAAADQFTDGDGEVYNTAVQFDVTANSAYGNVEWLGFNNPNYSRQYTQGETKVSNYGHLEEMEPGHHYTVSCLARVISGDGAIARFGYGGMHNNDPINRSDGHSGVSDFVTIEGSTWKRYSWGFDYNPQGDWYTETSEVVDGVTKITRSYNWAKKVSFGIGRKHTAVIQMCGFRLTEGDLYLPTKYDEMRDSLDTAMTGFAEDLEGAGTTAAGNLAEEETTTAAGNHAAGELFTMGGKLYRATVAIATGETITPGTNCAETTVETELSGKADKANPVFTGSISLGRMANTTTGNNSIAVGTDAQAWGNNSCAVGNGVQAHGSSAHADGQDTMANGNFSYAGGWGTTAWPRSQHVFGEYNAADPSFTVASARGKYIEIVGNGALLAESNARTLDWDGNEELAGGLTLGKGTADETTITAAQLKQLLALLN